MGDPAKTVSFREPDGLSTRGTLIVIPGRGELPDVYRRFGSRIAFDAYRVHVVGDPLTGPGFVRRQIEEAIDAAVTPGPIVLVGSDSGATYAASLLAGGDLGTVSGLILAGLPSGATITPAGSWDAELDARTTCPTHRGRISDALVEPGALYEPIPQGWLSRARLDEIRRPILGLHGLEDPISPLEGVRDAYEQGGDVQLVGIAGARHDVLNDQTHRTVAATVVLWLERLRNGDVQLPIAIAEPAGVSVA